MIKKYKYLLIFILLFTSKSYALSPEYQKELYVNFIIPLNEINDFK
jgi:hypothetical protein